MSLEAIAALAQAADTALKADIRLPTYLGGAHVFSQIESEDLELDDYIIVGSKDSSPFPWLVFNAERGETLGITIRLFSRVLRNDGTRLEGDGRVLVMAGHVSRILTDAQLPLSSFGKIATSTVSLQGTGLTPTGERIVGVVRFDAQCRKGNPNA